MGPGQALPSLRTSPRRDTDSVLSPVNGDSFRAVTLQLSLADTTARHNEGTMLADGDRE